MQNTVDKQWRICEGVLLFENTESASVASADEIYSAVFEKRYSELILQNIKYHAALRSEIEFSKYPVDLSIWIILNQTKNPFIEIAVYATTDDGKESIVSSNFNSDHVIIDSTWYPFSPGALEEINKVFESINVSKSGKISLGQYLILLKSNNDIISNKITSTDFGGEYDSSVDLPTGLNATLYPYQKKGWQWLVFYKKNEKVGGILADEMGLGKTLANYCSFKFRKRQLSFSISNCRPNNTS